MTGNLGQFESDWWRPVSESSLLVWSKYSNAERVSSLHLSRIDADIEDREAA